MRTMKTVPVFPQHENPSPEEALKADLPETMTDLREKQQAKDQLLKEAEGIFMSLKFPEITTVISIDGWLSRYERVR